MVLLLYQLKILLPKPPVRRRALKKIRVRKTGILFREIGNSIGRNASALSLEYSTEQSNVAERKTTDREV